MYCVLNTEIYSPQGPLLGSCDTGETNTRSTCNKRYKRKNIFCHEKSEELPKSNYDTGKVKPINGTPCPQIKNRQSKTDSLDLIDVANTFVNSEHRLRLFGKFCESDLGLA